jgi:hypothetical protein
MARYLKVHSLGKNQGGASPPTFNMENLLLLIFAGLSIGVAVIAYYVTHEDE